jgi:hypothetical protein
MFARTAPALLLALAAALPAMAETYKWVDAKGVVNYSNTPPPESARNSKVVEERISVMGLDPAVARAARAREARLAEAEERDWALRQQAILTQYAGAGYDAQPYNSSYYGYAGYGGYYGYRRPVVAAWRNYPAQRMQPRPFTHSVRAASRGGLRAAR